MSARSWSTSLSCRLSPSLLHGVSPRLLILVLGEGVEPSPAGFEPAASASCAIRALRVVRWVSPVGVEPTTPRTGDRFSAGHGCLLHHGDVVRSVGIEPTSSGSSCRCSPRERAPRAVDGGVAVSRTRNGLRIREPRSPYRPTPSCAGGGSRTHTGPLLRRMPPAVGLRRRGAGTGDRTLRGRRVRPVRSPARSSRAACPWSGWRDSNPQSPAPEAGALARLSHTQVRWQVATEGVEPSRPAL